MSRENLTKFAWLSIFAAVATIGLKAGAYFLTGSVGLLSDALESVINLAAAVIALSMLKLAARPPDEEHAFGHDKAEYFASGIEGTLILLAAVGIIYAAVVRLFYPQPIEQVGIGLIIIGVATLINLVVGQILIRVWKEKPFDHIGSRRASSDDRCLDFNRRYYRRLAGLFDGLALSRFDHRSARRGKYYSRRH